MTQPTSIIERVKSFEDACTILGLDPVKSIPYSEPANDREKAINAYAKLDIIAEALNEGWKPDWSNYDQWKYSPYFRNKSGFGLSCNDYGSWLTNANVGSRLCFPTSKLATYAGTQFEETYRELFTKN